MTDIEALLSVDAGRTPRGVVAVFLDDGTRGFRGGHGALGLAAGVAAGLSGVAGWGAAPITLLLLAGAFLALHALPTLPEDENRDPKRKVLVITATGLIVRDDAGLRRWLFEDLTDVVAGVQDSGPYLKLVDRAGRRHTVSCPALRRGERVRRLLSARMQLSRTV